MFHHGADGKAKFGPRGSQPAGSKVKAASTPHEKEHGPAQAPHERTGEKHVTETHPGKTQPHPATGVHAFHGHHTGGGRYESHTHHDGGEVETRQHGSADEMQGAMSEAFPPDAHGEPDADDMDMRDGGGSFEESLGGSVGGGSSY